MYKLLSDQYSEQQPNNEPVGYMEIVNHVVTFFHDNKGFADINNGFYFRDDWKQVFVANKYDGDFDHRRNNMIEFWDSKMTTEDVNAFKIKNSAPEEQQFIYLKKIIDLENQKVDLYELTTKKNEDFLKLTTLFETDKENLEFKLFLSKYVEPTGLLSFHVGKGEP
eukprot:UN05692